MGEKVAELARLRRRRLISQPRVAELARLPWVPERAALNPAKGLTPCAQGRTGDSARGQMHQSEEFLENPRDNHLPIPKGLNCCSDVGLNARGFGETLGRVGRRVHPGAQGTLPIGTSDQQPKLPTKPYAHGVQPLAGLSATRLRPRVASQARQPWADLLNAFGVASQARQPSRPPAEHSYSPPPPRWADLWNAFGVTPM